MADQFIIVLRNEDGGFDYVGPFETELDATTWHEEVWPTGTNSQSWWVAPLKLPH